MTERIQAEPGRGVRSIADTWAPWLVGSLALWLGMCAFSATSQAEAAPANVPTAPPFAVVELYTSEGCSSCPPADALLSELVARARRDGIRVYPLAFHVDSWNRLGWRDPWSAAAYSERQAQYEGRFESRYTPQMVVNGVEGFVGSDRERAEKSLRTALATPARASIQARAEVVPHAQQAAQDAAQSLDAGAVYRVTYMVRPVLPQAVVHVALAERELASQVGRGENAGRTLRHDNVVRAFVTVDLAASGEGSLTIAAPTNLRSDRAAFVVYVQDASDQRILGATGLALPVPTEVHAERR